MSVMKYRVLNKTKMGYLWPKYRPCPDVYRRDERERKPYETFKRLSLDIWKA